MVCRHFVPGCELLDLFYSRTRSLSEDIWSTKHVIVCIWHCIHTGLSRQYILLTLMFKDYQELMWSNTTMLKNQYHAKVTRRQFWQCLLHTNPCVRDSELGLLLQHRAADSPMHTTLQACACAAQSEHHYHFTHQKVLLCKSKRSRAEKNCE